jgi:hypothetical protein
MCTAYGSSYGEASNWGHSESDAHGETECRSYMTSISPSKSISMGTPIASTSFWGSSSHVSAQPNARVRAAAADLERQIRKLATHLTVAEFHAVRVRLEDAFDDVLLNHLP